MLHHQRAPRTVVALLQLGFVAVSIVSFWRPDRSPDVADARLQQQLGAHHPTASALVAQLGHGDAVLGLSLHLLGDTLVLFCIWRFAHPPTPARSQAGPWLPHLRVFTEATRPSRADRNRVFGTRLATDALNRPRMKNETLAAYRYLSNNWAQIQASTACGCCHCMMTFPPEEIVAWTGLQFEDADNPAAIDRQTALCPHCGNETVLGNGSGFPVDVSFLSRMNEAWFQKTIIRKPAPKR